MLSILSVAGLLATIAWLARKRPFVIYLLALLLIAYVWRLTSVAYVDVAGPLHAIELFRDIGGGRAAPWLLLCYLILIGSVVIVFRSSRLRAMVQGAPTPAELAGQPWLDRLSNVILVLTTLFVALAFIQLLQTGVVPLFAGIERYIFTNQYGGVMHRLVVKYGIHLSFILGLFYSSGMLRWGRPDRRFLYVLFALFVYLFLVGNRFSAFYSHSCFFVMPVTALAIRRRCAGVGSSEAASDTPLISRRALKSVGLLGMLAALIVFAQYYSLVHTRGFAGELLRENLVHRVFVIQGELWNTSHERVFLRGDYDPAVAFDKLFVNPVIQNRNSTLPFLMELEIGDQAYPILEIGSVYTGGYPEVLFELLGPVLGFGAVALMAYLTARWLYALVWAIIWQRYIRIVLVFYVAYAFLLFSLSGMLNIFSTWKFLVKLGAVGCWILFEKARDLRRQSATDRPTIQVLTLPPQIAGSVE